MVLASNLRKALASLEALEALEDLEALSLSFKLLSYHTALGFKLLSLKRQNRTKETNNYGFNDNLHSSQRAICSG